MTADMVVKLVLLTRTSTGRSFNADRQDIFFMKSTNLHFKSNLAVQLTCFTTSSLTIRNRGLMQMVISIYEKP